jgi:hypothetical protein
MIVKKNKYKSMFLNSASQVCKNQMKLKLTHAQELRLIELESKETLRPSEKSELESLLNRKYPAISELVQNY